MQWINNLLYLPGMLTDGGRNWLPPVGELILVWFTGSLEGVLTGGWEGVWSIGGADIECDATWGWRYLGNLDLICSWNTV